MITGQVDPVARALAQQAIADAGTAQGDATQALADALAAQGDATQAIADAATAQAAADLRGEIEIISFTRDLSLANGTVNYPVPSGRTPKWIEVRAWLPAATSRSNGVGDGTQRTIEITAGSGNASGNTNSIVSVYAAGSGTATQGATETLSAGNVALAWVKTNAPTGTAVGSITCHF